MIRKVNIFVALSPLQLLNAEALIKQEHQRRYNILINPHSFTYNSDKWTKAINGGFLVPNIQNSFFNKISFQYNKVKFYKQFINSINREIPSASEYFIFFSHLEDVLTNYFFFSFRKNENRCFFIIEDGVLNYYKLIVSGKKKRDLLRKLLLYRFFGIPFKFYTGYVTGIDRHNVKSQYVRLPEKAQFPEKSKLLNISKISYESNNKVILILGQESFINIYGLKLYKTNFSLLLDLIINQNPNWSDITFYYKPHRIGHFEDAEILALSKGIKFKFIRTDDSIESIIGIYKPYQIYSFNSSALMNIKLALDRDTHVLIYSLNCFSNKLDKLFRKLGINILSK